MRNKGFTMAVSMGFTLLGTAAQAEPIDNTNTLPDAKPGQCYAKVMIPANYETKTEKVLVQEASEKIESIPAKYEWVEEKVLVKEASSKLIPVPAVYETVSEKIEVSPRQTVWVNTLDKRGVPVSSTLLTAAKTGGVDVDGAIAGMCFKEYFQPTQFKTETKDVLVSEASENIKIIPAKYEMVEKKVLVKEAAKKIVEIPVSYETVTEKVLVEPAKTVWKKGNGLVEKVDNTTGEIMCLVEIPAVYKTITKKVVKSPATTKVVEIPAVYETVKMRKLVSPAKETRTKTPEAYKTVSKQVKIADAKFSWYAVHDTAKPEGKWTGNQICLKEIPAKFETFKKRVVKSPATIKKEEVPAVYDVIKVRKLVAAAQEKRTKIPEEFKMVTKRQKVGDERLEWRQVLCETNMTKEIVLQVQEALKKAGYDPGSVDGVVGGATLRAVDNFQRSKDLPRGGLTIRTLETLGVKLSSN